MLLICHGFSIVYEYIYNYLDYFLEMVYLVCGWETLGSSKSLPMKNREYE